MVTSSGAHLSFLPDVLSCRRCGIAHVFSLVLQLAVSLPFVVCFRTECSFAFSCISSAVAVETILNYPSDAIFRLVV